jgi:hypothetical protein
VLHEGDAHLAPPGAGRSGNKPANVRTSMGRLKAPVLTTSRKRQLLYLTNWLINED